jgi:hypothetical protein
MILKRNHTLTKDDEKQGLEKSSLDGYWVNTVEEDAANGNPHDNVLRE